MLYEFLEKFQVELLSLIEDKNTLLAGPLRTSAKMKRGLPEFYELLLSLLKRSVNDYTEDKILVGASAHGKELLRLGYSLSQVVHAYGAVCQAVTELAFKKNIKITPKEFNILNMSLDLAIAAAVSEYQFCSVYENEQKEIQNLGILAHELRNALSSATVAYEMIKLGLVGMGGSTAKALEDNLVRMKYLIDHALSEARMRADPEIIIESFYLSNLVDQILLTSKTESGKKNLKVLSEVSHDIEMYTDRQLLLSTLANLIQNAIKYSKNGGHILVQAKASGENIVIEVQDECGGLAKDKIDNLFKPFVFGSENHTGLGLGLTIVLRAVTLLQGKISAYNNPGKGCAFIVEIPKVLKPKSDRRTAVSGSESIQPKFTKKE